MTRVALLDAPHARELAAALGRAGVDATLVGPAGSAGPAPAGAPTIDLLDALLRRRGFTGPLAHVPLSALALRRGGYDVVHAFTAPDALAARWSGRPVVFTCVERLSRASVADRRLRLALLRAAVEDSALVTAADEAAADALRRWMAVDAPVVADPGEWPPLYARVSAG